MKFKIFLNILNRLLVYNFTSKIMTKNMMSPDNGIFGLLAIYVMFYSNKLISEDVVKKLKISKEDNVLEIGCGNGHSIEKIIQFEPNSVKGVEISQRFIEVLKNKFRDSKVEIIPNDAKNLEKFIKNKSIDKFLAINVVYFLSPLEVYIKEIYRIMKVGGQGIFACKFKGIQTFDSEVAPNKELNFILEVLKKVGFTVTFEDVDLGSFTSRYIAIYFSK